MCVPAEILVTLDGTRQDCSGAYPLLQYLDCAYGGLPYRETAWAWTTATAW